MTKSTITRERLEWLSQISCRDDIEDIGGDEIRELASMALAAMDGEPVAWMHNNNDIGIPAITTSQKIGQHWMAEFKDVQPLYRHAQQPVDSEPVGYLFHNEYGAVLYSISDDATEGFSLIGPIYSVPQPAPVVPNGLRLALSNAGIAAPESDEMLAATCEKHIQALVTWVKDRKPFQSAPVVPSFEEWLSAANRKPLGWVKGAMREASDACRAAMLQAGTLTNEGTIQAVNSPVIPDGYVMVPMRLTAENGAKGALSGEFSETKFVNCPECFGDDECETCDGSGRIEITVPVTWATIKEIWAKGVEHFAAAPQEVKP